MYVAAQQTAIKTEHANRRCKFSARRGDDRRHRTREPDTAIAAVAHEITFRDGIEGREGHNFGIQPGLRQKCGYPFRVELGQSLSGRYTNFIRIGPAKSFSRLHIPAQVTNGNERAHPAERFNSLDAQIFRTRGQNFAFGYAQKFWRRFRVGAHPDFVKRERNNHGVKQFE